MVDAAKLAFITDKTMISVSGGSFSKSEHPFFSSFLSDLEIVLMLFFHLCNLRFFLFYKKGDFLYLMLSLHVYSLL